MKIKYEIYDLGGNTTAIITAKLTDKECLELVGKIMKEHPEVEQVAMILSVDKNVCEFKMAGGEFCGNAIRAVAELMRRNYDFEESIIVINGMSLKAKSDGTASEYTIQKNVLVKTVDCKEIRCIVMNGITHIIVPKIDNVLGIMFVDENKIEPWVYFAQSGTDEKSFHKESGCLGGSIATALCIQPNGESKIVQPSGEKYTITIGDETIKAGGKVAFIKSCEV